jgi:hypothetical protein
MAPAREVRVDVLDRDRRFIDEDADGERQPAERHDVDRLARRPRAPRRREQRKRDRDDDDRRASPVAQEHQHHQAGEQGTEMASCSTACSAPTTLRGLIQLVRHRDVVRHQSLESGRDSL